jgi:uncharacterized protein YcbK (DUF882 family)/LysM repeat protein
MAGLRGGAMAAALVLAVAGGALSPYSAAAEQKHVVRIGQSLGVIARQYGISVTTLASANGVHRDGVLREGQVLRIPGAGSVEVTAGQTLGKIARDHRVSVAALAAANGMDREASLKIGQRLVLPEGAVEPKSAAASADAKPALSPASKAPVAKAASSAPAGKVPIAKSAPPARGPVATAEETKPAAVKTEGVRADARKSTPAVVVAASAKVANKATPGEKPSRSPWGKPKQPGVAELYRIATKEVVRLRLVDAKGRPRQDARRALREFLRPRDSQRRKTPNARLLSLLARVSDHFGGRPIHVVSGYRVAKGLTRKTSRHVAGEAIDFRIPGVPLTVLRDYCQQFPEVGVGYYPTTEFVHLDVRKQPARWTDWSLPGQAPVLIKPIDGDENGKDEMIAAPPEDETAERNGGDEPSVVTDAPTG